MRDLVFSSLEYFISGQIIFSRVPLFALRISQILTTVYYNGLADRTYYQEPDAVRDTLYSVEGLWTGYGSSNDDPWNNSIPDINFSQAICIFIRT